MPTYQSLTAFSEDQYLLEPVYEDHPVRWERGTMHLCFKYFSSWIIWICYVFAIINSMLKGAKLSNKSDIVNELDSFKDRENVEDRGFGF